MAARTQYQTISKCFVLNDLHPRQVKAFTVVQVLLSEL
jgi:hypothetical protein